MDTFACAGTAPRTTTGRAGSSASRRASRTTRTVDRHAVLSLVLGDSEFPPRACAGSRRCNAFAVGGGTSASRVSGACSKGLPAIYRLSAGLREEILSTIRPSRVGHARTLDDGARRRAQKRGPVADCWGGERARRTPPPASVSAARTTRLSFRDFSGDAFRTHRPTRAACVWRPSWGSSRSRALSRKRESTAHITACLDERVLRNLLVVSRLSRGAFRTHRRAHAGGHLGAPAHHAASLFCEEARIRTQTTACLDKC